MAIDSRLAGGATALVETACAHCGLPVPAGLVEVGAPRQFCCQGCRTVHAVIHEHGLERYYALRDAAERGVPARSTDRAYGELDDPAFLARSVRHLPGGLAAVDLYLEGVHCAACVWLVEQLPRLAPGVVDARLDLPRSRVSVTWDPAATGLPAAARQLAAIGYPPHPCRGQEAERARRREDRAMLARIGLAGAVAANVMAIALALYAGTFDPMDARYTALFRWASLVITVPSLVWGGGVFVAGAVTALGAGVLSMDLPISLGLLVGFGHGALNTVLGRGEVYFDSVAVLIFLLLVGRYVQRRQQRAAGDATELLAALHPTTARRLEGEQVCEVPLETLRPGDLVEVRAGDVVPADGVIVSGRSALDVSLLSGESRPTDAREGDAVHAGTVNVSSRLVVRAVATGESTRVGRLMRLVEEHARRRAPIVQLADRIAGKLVAAVLLLAGLTAWLWWRVDPVLALDHAVALLIVTCPCALGLATPLAVSAALGQAARAGILIKGADVLETLTRPGRMWLDKTGTLTGGRPELRFWAGAPAVLALAAAVERRSAHPLATALARAAPEAPSVPVEMRETHGGGVEARADGRAVIIGSPAFVSSRTGALPGRVADQVVALVGRGLTPVVIGVDGQAAAVAGFGDAVRPDAARALQRIRGLGWQVGILSGDHAGVVAAVGRQLDVDSAVCRGGVPPEDKLAVVTAGRAEGPVLMVGDGVNDAAALAAATVGIAVHGGAEAALAAAHVYIARPGVGQLADLLDGAHRTMRVIRRNLAASLAYNTVGIGLAMAGLINPLVAAILMPLSSLTVIASSYRARSFRPVPEGS